MLQRGMPDVDDDDFSFLQRRILALSGIHLSAAKKDLMRARLASRLQALGLPSIKAYRQYLAGLSATDEEWQELINQITTNKTDFFRESAHFKYLLECFLPAFKRREPTRRLRAWSAACSSGEEAYTLAMVLQRSFQDESRFEILASDIDTEVLEKAENGVYPLSRLGEIPFDYHGLGIVKGKGDVQNWFKIRASLQARVRFARINLVELERESPAPFDIILCRNVFIYFQPQTIQAIIANFHGLLQRQGALILGHSESLQVKPKLWKPCGSSVYLKEADGDHHRLKHPASPITLQTRSAKKRVLIVEPSIAVQEVLSESLARHPGLDVVAVVGDPKQLDAALARYRPDVLTYDVRMMGADGQDVLERILARQLLPVVVMSAASREDSRKVLDALEMGAVDSLQKPANLDELRLLSRTWAERILEAAQMKVHLRRVHKAAAAGSKSPAHTVRQLTPFVLIGASTGGVQALTEILAQLPDEVPPILIVQHIPPIFSASFADRLNALCRFTVKEASDGDLVQENQVLIAPGGRHMEVISSKLGYKVQLTDGPACNRHKPSVDILFHSAAQHFGNRAIGILLTGMGVDGAAGLKKMKEQGARTLVQDEASSAVFGMPKEAIRLAAADFVCSLEQIPTALLRLIRESGSRRKVS